MRRHAPGLSLACREAKSRLPSLLIGSLVYGSVVVAGAVGVNAVLCDTDLDLGNAGRRSIAVPGHVTVLVLRTLDAAVPSPGSPFAEFVPALRQFSRASRQSSSCGVEYSISSSDYWRCVSDSAPVQAPLINIPMLVEESDSTVFAISFVSLGMLLLAESLLRFTPVMAMNARGRTRLDAITPVLRGVGFGIRHFGAITAHVWLLRLAFVGVYSIFFVLPVILSQDVAPLVVKSVTRSVMGHWSLPLTLVCYWLVMALFTAFGTVYDARLCIALSRAQASNVAARLASPPAGAYDATYKITVDAAAAVPEGTPEPVKITR